MGAGRRTLGRLHGLVGRSLQQQRFGVFLRLEPEVGDAGILGSQQPVLVQSGQRGQSEGRIVQVVAGLVVMVVVLVVVPGGHRRRQVSRVVVERAGRPLVLAALRLVGAVLPQGCGRRRRRRHHRRVLKTGRVRR